MNRPDHPVASPAGAAPTSGWRRRVLVYAACLALIAIGVLLGLLGLIKVQGGIIPLNIQTREGCLADPAVVDAQAPCPKQAEAVLEYPDGRTVVIRELPKRSSGVWTWPPKRWLRPSGGEALGTCWWRRCWSKPGSRRSPGSWSSVGAGAPGA